MESSGQGVGSGRKRAVNKVVVKGCGDSWINGTYKRDGKFRGMPKYVKTEAGFWYGIFFGTLIKPGIFSMLGGTFTQWLLAAMNFLMHPQRMN